MEAGAKVISVSVNLRGRIDKWTLCTARIPADHHDPEGSLTCRLKSTVHRIPLLSPTRTETQIPIPNRAGNLGKQSVLECHAAKTMPRGL